MTGGEPSPTTKDPPQSDFVAVHFTVPASVGGTFADVVGDFLTWVPLPMDRHVDGSFNVTIRLQAERSWHYRFVVDGDRWINDWNADDYVTHADGSCMSLLRT